MLLRAIIFKNDITCLRVREWTELAASKTRFDITPKLCRYITVKKTDVKPSFVFVAMLSTLMTHVRCDSVEAGVTGGVSVVSVQDKLICVRLVMPHCIFGMQVFLSEIVSFVLTKCKASCTNLSSRLGDFLRHFKACLRCVLAGFRLEGLMEIWHCVERS